jgi:hypothetical protein
MDDICVNTKAREEIETLREKHYRLMQDFKEYEPTIKDGVVTVTKEQVDKCYDIWGKAESVRDEIELIIMKNSK